MKRSYRWAIAAAMVSVLLLAGCDTVHEAAQTVKKDIQEVAAAAGDSVGNAAAGAAERLKREGEPVELSAEGEARADTVLHIDHRVGNIRLAAGDGDAVKVKTTIWFLKERSSYRNLSEQAVTSLIPKDGQLELITSSKEDTGRNLWDWADSKYGYSDFIIDYDIELPATVAGIDVASDVGEISVDGFRGTYRIHSDVGNIVVKEGRIAGTSDIGSNAGSVELRLNGIEEGGGLTARTDVGSIRAAFADSMKYTLKAESELGALSGVSNGEHEINGGGPPITLSTSVGPINVE
ncbi:MULTISPECIES: hypothetical protein [Paenibacillus]|uniref:Adhesin domain-containing protein n=1 Tax=Paenibacillus albilobatus TaxID=2716884 RepID=A0A920CBX3_9BACL|nr:MULTISPECIES: hypothetical protein [Paenibacillus]GIO32323.1 hypothetical protein J2TS6_34640 [Paenibacillus albilobatus]